jgi:hypothetical protein
MGQSAAGGKENVKYSPVFKISTLASMITWIYPEFLYNNNRVEPYNSFQGAHIEGVLAFSKCVHFVYLTSPGNSQVG